jgi:hypothetical protein
MKARKYKAFPGGPILAKNEPRLRSNLDRFLLEEGLRLRQILCARAHGMWTYEPRQGRNAATAVCSASAVVTLAFKFTFCDLRMMDASSSFNCNGS